MTRDESKALLTEVRANIARLDACGGPHEFDEPFRTIGALVTDWACKRCSGHVTAHDKRWYERGLDHGRGLPP